MSSGRRQTRTCAKERRTLGSLDLPKVMELILLTAVCLSMLVRLGAGVRPPPTIAIIGGGIGGVSTAHFVHELFQDLVQIDLYEAKEVGGRLSTVVVGEHEYEMGGSVIHPRNKYMVNFTSLLGLKKRRSSTSKFGLYDGREFLYTESSNWELLNMLKIVWRYGFDTLKLKKYIEDMLQQFDRIYQLQSEGHTFNNVTELLSAMNPEFVEYLEISTEEGFKQKGFSEIIINELISAALLVNYGQTPSVQKFVGSVSIAGASDGLWAVHGGNRRVPQELLKLGKSNLLHAKVENVSLEQDTEKFEVIYIQSGVLQKRIYDVVVLAVPMSKNTQSVQLANFPSTIDFSGKYHQTVSTLVEGKVNTSYFGDDGKLIDEVLCVNSKLFFSSLGRVYPVDDNGKFSGEYGVWKVFSHNPLSTDQLQKLFTSIKKVTSRKWLAYPHYDTQLPSAKFTLFKNLYHVNAIEWAASAMEMSAIGAKNVALLAFKNWYNLVDIPKSFNKPKEEL